MQTNKQIYNPDKCNMSDNGFVLLYVSPVIDRRPVQSVCAKSYMSTFESRLSHTMCNLLLTYLPLLRLRPELENFLPELLLSDPPFSLTLPDTLPDTAFKSGFSCFSSASSSSKLWLFWQTQVGSLLEQNNFAEL